MRRRPLLVVVIAVGAALSAVTGAAGAPATPEAGSSDWVQVSAGGGHTCGIRTTGRLYCWGADGAGQLGDGGTDTGRTTPTQVAGGATNWVQVSAGDDHTCGRRRNGRLYCWGRDDSGQLGDGGTNTNKSTPVEVAGGFTDWTRLSAGNGHTCARRSNGRLYCWGDNSQGELGTGGANPIETRPRQVAGNATNWKNVSAGNEHTCGVRTTGRLFCWGNNEAGQLGNGDAPTDRPTPVRVPRGDTWTQVTVGNNHTCARRNTGRLFCWGLDTSGQLGNGAANSGQSTPFPVAGDVFNWTVVTAGHSHTCARRNTGRLFCWGLDTSGQLGDGAPNASQQVPVQVAGRATDWIGVDAGTDHTCSRITTKRLFCWGHDGNGRLGNGGANTDSPGPLIVWA